MKTLRKMGMEGKLFNFIKLINKKDPPANILDSGRRSTFFQQSKVLQRCQCLVCDAVIDL